MNSDPDGGIVGRVREVAGLRGLVADVVAGRGGVVWVGGEPGIGKSTLVEVGLGDAPAGGVRVFRGAADELTQAFPLRLMADGLAIDQQPVDPYRVEIADLLAGRGSGVDAVRAASERIVALVQRECATGPVVVVADDLQWADEASLGVWATPSRADRADPTACHRGLPTGAPSRRGGPAP